MKDFESCPCSGRSLARLIKPAVLMLLVDEDLHAYEVVQRLTDLPAFGDPPPEKTGVYRALHSMESMGLVTSRWETSDTGPDRRRYHLTSDGVACSRQWVTTLRQYRREVDALLTMAEQTLSATPQSETCCVSGGSGGTASCDCGGES